MKLYTLKEVSEICRITIGTLYHHISKKKLKTHQKTFKWGKRMSLVTEKDLNHYLFHHYFDKGIHETYKKKLAKSKL